MFHKAVRSTSNDSTAKTEATKCREKKRRKGPTNSPAGIANTSVDKNPKNLFHTQVQIRQKEQTEITHAETPSEIIMAQPYTDSPLIHIHPHSHSHPHSNSNFHTQSQTTASHQAKQHISRVLSVCHRHTQPGWSFPVLYGRAVHKQSMGQSSVRSRDICRRNSVRRLCSTFCVWD